MRLIDADKLKERLFVEADYDEAIEEEVFAFQCGWNDALKSVMQFAPTVEVVAKNETTTEVVRCKDCRWGREVCGNIECSADLNLPPEYHGYEWFCPNGERRKDETG